MDFSGCKPNKIQVDQDSQFYTRSMELWLHNTGIEVYSTYSEGKPVAAEKFIRTLKNKISENMTAVSKKCTLINQMKQLANIIEQ